MHRFPSAAVQVLGSLRWDVLRIFEELKTGLRTLAQRKLPISSLSVDSWGVDYVLINAVHPVLWPPFHYRDARTDETYDKVRANVGVQTDFCRNGHSVHVHQHNLPLGLGRGEKPAAARIGRLFPDHRGLFQLSFFRRTTGRRKQCQHDAALQPAHPCLVERA